MIPPDDPDVPARDPEGPPAAPDAEASPPETAAPDTPPAPDVAPNVAPAEAVAEKPPRPAPERALPDGTRRIVLSSRDLRRQSRRDFFLFGAGAVAVAAGFYTILPDSARARFLTDRQRELLDSLEARAGLGPKRRENLLNRALTFDDDVAEALYSPRRLVRTYRRSDVTPVPNNYAGETPDPDYIADWKLSLEGLASGKTEEMEIGDLLARFRRRDQITRLCCVEGWSAIGSWGGFRFADFLDAYRPIAGARWAKLESAVNLDSDGNPDPYYVSIDLATARHPQTLLATHQNGGPLSVEHGAPIRLLAPMKLGLKNIKAITKITYSASEPADYWNEQGYSKYDGL